MSTAARWTVAQGYERGYWEQAAEEVARGATGKVDFYQWRAEQLKERLEALGHTSITDGSAKVLEVGAGPIGLAGFFPATEQVSVDPLEGFYRSNPAFAEIRSPDVDYREGVGEALPCEDDHFDLLIIENCIDHVRDMDVVMAELRRVLKPGGILYLTVNARSRIGYVVHRVLSRLKIDPGHPHTLTPKRADKLITSSGFSMIDVEVGSYWQAFRQDLASRTLRDTAKAVLGVSEYVVSTISRKV